MLVLILILFGFVFNLSMVETFRCFQKKKLLTLVYEIIHHILMEKCLVICTNETTGDQLFISQKFTIDYTEKKLTCS